MERASVVWMRAAVGAVVSAAVLLGVAVIWRGSLALRTATEQVRSENEFAVTVQPYAPPPNAGFEVVSSPQVFLQAARFQDHLFIAGPARLQEYDPGGVLIRQYPVGSELPSSPLVALASSVLADSHETELLIATANDGILAFNGRAFRQILPVSAEARGINAILPVASGHLLIGTKKRGVLVYDGKRMSVLHPLLDNAHVTALAGDEADLWVGTLNRGVIHFHGGEAEAFSEEQGLPDSDVQSLAIAGSKIYVGTVSGVAVFDGASYSRVLAPGVFATALFATSTDLYVGSEDQGVLVIPLEGRRPNANLTQGGELEEIHQLFASGGAMFAVARNGLYRMKTHVLGWQRVLASENTVLSDRNISALATDANGQLWIGYFDHGLDLLASDERRVRHVEDEHVFCVNRILPDSKTGSIDVATANGMVQFDDAGGEQQVLTRADGLIADHVTDIANYRGGLAIATPAGLTFLDASGAHSMYAFHGLVNNHVYALGVSGTELMAGTLGGLSRLDEGDVRFNYTTSSSNLKHNWITSVVRVGPEWMVGTYGAGVLALDSSGHFHAYETASGTLEINPNAMLVTDNYVLAGSLGKGLYLYDRKSERWSVIRTGLPSLNITAFAVANGYIFIGTDNGLVRIPEQKLRS
jgi:ligand-binding sensor domain-containing protein